MTNRSGPLRGLPSLLLAVLLTACAAAPPAPRGAATGPVSPEARAIAEAAVARFVAVVGDVEPVAEALCRRHQPGANCDFLIAVDDRVGQPPNAFQTIGPGGRPVIVFNLGLVASVRNADELAFVMGHEAAHHILAHIPRQQEAASIGATTFGNLAALSGASPEAVRIARRIGATVGARTYSKEFELEADRLGAIIALRAGYDPVRGAAFFERLPDPGDGFLASHPPNALRIEVVRRTVAALG